MKIVLGLGCDRNTPFHTLEQAVDKALAEINQSRQAISEIATIDKKSDEIAILQLAEKYNWPLQLYSAEQLAKVKVPSPSAVVLKYMGTPSVSEAAALLAADTDMSHLLLEKFKYRGTEGKNATVSIVEIP